MLRYSSGHRESRMVPSQTAAVPSQSAYTFSEKSPAGSGTPFSLTSTTQKEWTEGSLSNWGQGIMGGRLTQDDYRLLWVQYGHLRLFELIWIFEWSENSHYSWLRLLQIFMDLNFLPLTSVFYITQFSSQGDWDLGPSPIVSFKIFFKKLDEWCKQFVDLENFLSFNYFFSFKKSKNILSGRKADKIFEPLCFMKDLSVNRRLNTANYSTFHTPTSLSWKIIFWRKFGPNGIWFFFHKFFFGFPRCNTL